MKQLIWLNSYEGEAQAQPLLLYAFLFMRRKLKLECIRCTLVIRYVHNQSNTIWLSSISCFLSFIFCAMLLPNKAEYDIHSVSLFFLFFSHTVKSAAVSDATAWRVCLWVLHTLGILHTFGSFIYWSQWEYITEILRAMPHTVATMYEVHAYTNHKLANADWELFSALAIVDRYNQNSQSFELVTFMIQIYS